MAMGPGRYDVLCTEVRKKAKALGAVVVILQGEFGMGFSIQAPPEIVATLPEMFRSIANEIEGDMSSDIKNYRN